MKTLPSTVVCLVATFVSIESANAEQYGAPLTMKDPIALEAAIAQVDDEESAASVLVESKVGSVCEAKGCWMALTGTARDDIRVTFKDYGFFVPFSIVGKTVRVQGTLEKVSMTLEETRHYVQDAGGDPRTVTAPRIEYRLVASGVEVRS